MRRFIFDKEGDVSHYLTGAGVLYDRSNSAVAWLQDDGVVSPRGALIGWFDGSFLWDEAGLLLGFVKGAELGSEVKLELPQTKPLNFKPAPVPSPFYPLLVKRDKPSFNWRWSERTLASEGNSSFTEVYV